MHENPFYEFVDIAADITCPGLDDDDENNASDLDDHDEVADKSAPEWVLKFEAQLHDRKRFRTQQPIIFHLKTISTPEIAAVVQAMCVRFELPFAEIKGNPSDNLIALGEVQKNNALVTYLSDPDPQFLESSWTHQRRGNIWFLVSPYPIESKLLTPVLPLPFPGEHIEVPMPEGTVFLAERTVLL